MYYSEENLRRFISAQERDFPTALREIQAGRKRSHWMWYIFPQLQGLGMSPTADYYGIRDLEEAKDFLAHPYLGNNLIRISQALLELESSDARAVLGYPDNLKLRSSMTLFECAEPSQKVFAEVLEKFYGGRRDSATLDILGL